MDVKTILSLLTAKKIKKKVKKKRERKKEQE